MLQFCASAAPLKREDVRPLNYGIGSDFPVRLFVGARVRNVLPLENIFYLHFERPRSLLHPRWPAQFSLGIESTWHLSRIGYARLSAQAASGDAVHFAAELTGQVVIDATITSPRAFVLRFAKAEIEITDDSDQYESFSIPELSIYV